MLIVQANIRSRIAKATEEEMDWLNGYLQVPDRSYATRKANDGAAGAIYLVNGVDNTLPTGFVPLIVKEAAKAGVQVDILDKRVKPCEPDPNADLEWLKHHPAVPDPITYQIGAVEACVKHGRGICHMTTSSGKTEVVVGVWKSLPCRWVFLVHRTTLVHQAAERFTKRAGVKPGIVAEGEWKPDTRPHGFTFCTFQTIAAAVKRNDSKALEFLKSIQGFATDECHVLPSRTYTAVCNAMPNAYFRFGFSGTPLARGDAKSIWAIGTTGPVIYRVRADELMKLGVITRPKITMVTCEQFSSQTENRDYKAVYQELIAKSAKRNNLIVDLATKAPKPAMVFIKDIAHGRTLTKRLQAAGMATEFVYGAKATSQRQATVERLRRSDTDVVVASTVFVEGVDVPELATMINASGGSSVIATLQKTGRVTRTSAGKTEASVWDILDSGDKTLTAHSRARKKAYLSEGYSVTVE